MKKLASIMLVAGALVLAASVPSQARESHDGHARAVVEHRGGEHRAFVEHRGFEHGRGGISIGFGWGAAYPYGGYASPAYAYAPPPTYWYFCPSYGAYYPNVPSCPVAWVPVPAAP